LLSNTLEESPSHRNTEYVKYGHHMLLSLAISYTTNFAVLTTGKKLLPLKWSLPLFSTKKESHSGIYNKCMSFLK
jgi:hypothetical protein